LELLPVPTATAYRITAELRQDYAFEEYSNLGLYFAHETWENPHGRQNSFARCVFADLGPHAMQHGDKLQGKGSQVQFGPAWLGPSARNPGRSHFAQTPALFYVPEHPSKPPGEWRKVIITVRPNEASAHWEEQLVGTIPQSRWTDWFVLLPQLYGDIASFEGRASFGGAIGVYVYGASLTLRRFDVEPLDD
jgi:hypothetical protein